MSSTAARKRCLAAIVADLTPLMKTKAGWCLQEGMNHVIKANGGALAPVIQKEGVPLVYQTQKKNPCDDGILEWKEPRNCFQSLCRIIAGQQWTNGENGWTQQKSSTQTCTHKNRVITCITFGCSLRSCYTWPLSCIRVSCCQMEPWNWKAVWRGHEITNI